MKCTLVTAVCVSVWLSLAAFPYYCTNPDVTWGDDRRCPLVVHYWADLKSVPGFRCYDNIAPNAKCQRVLGLCLVELVSAVVFFHLPSFHDEYQTPVRSWSCEHKLCTSMNTNNILQCSICNSCSVYRNNVLKSPYLHKPDIRRHYLILFVLYRQTTHNGEFKNIRSRK